MSLQFSSSALLASTSFSGLASKNTTATAAASCVAKTTTTTNNIVDTHAVVKVVAPAFTPTSATSVDIYVAGSIDGTNWPDAVLGTDAAVSLSANSNNLIWLGTLMCHTSAGTFTSEPLNIASRFGGVMPKAWCVVIQNNLPAGVSLTSGTVSYTEAYYN